MRTLVLILLTLMPAFAAGNAAAAGVGMVSAKDPQKIVEIAKGFGTATLEKDSSGDPKITGRIDGTRYMILFFGCTNNKDCSSIQFAAGWSMPKDKRLSIAQMNEWNKTKRFGKAYIDDENDPVIEMDLPLYDVPVAYLEDSFEWWQAAVGEFSNYVNK